MPLRTVTVGMSVQISCFEIRVTIQETTNHILALYRQKPPEYPYCEILSINQERDEIIRSYYALLYIMYGCTKYLTNTPLGIVDLRRCCNSRRQFFTFSYYLSRLNGYFLQIWRNSGR